MKAPHQILTAAQMRAAEDTLIAGGETVESLMERAGRGAADWVYRMAAGRAVTVLSGPGNNGGDGYVIARVLAERGVPVSVVAPLSPKTEAAMAARAAWGGSPVEHAHGHVFVDCLFGTGLARALSAELAELLADLVASHDRWIAVDLPSGVDSDSGALLNDSLPQFDLTIALGAWKRAHWLMPSATIMGERRLYDIGCPPVAGAPELALPGKLYPPAADAHKYTRGLLAVVGGAMPGAAMLAARSAMHGGAGYVKLLTATRPDNVPDDLVIDSRPIGEALADKRIAVALVGPGFGSGNAARERLCAALAQAGPLVLDADALNLLEPEMLVGRTAPLVLTPHSGEMKRLCGTFAIAAMGKFESALALAAATRAVVVAKGPDTLVASNEGAIDVLPSGPSWLSTAGTGDVLAGLVASRLATGQSARSAALEACALHAEAARLAGAAFSASDLVNHIPAAYRAFL